MKETDRNIPKRRFKEFEHADAWEQRKLTDEVELYSGLTYSPDDVINENGTLVLRSSNVKNGEVIDADNVYVNPEVVNSDNVQEGDIIVVVRNGSRALIGKHGQIKGKMDNTVIGAFMTGMRSENASFTNALLSTPFFDDEVAKNMGATINQITNGMFHNMYFMFPEDMEQKKIGAFFTDLDNLITLHQRKLEKLKNLKSAYLSEMFPAEGERKPKRRFAEFTDDWEQRKWVDTVDVSTEMVDPIPGHFDNLPHIAPGNIESYAGRIYDNVKLVKEENLISGKFHFFAGDIIYGKINPQLGKYFLARFEGLTSADAYVLNAKNGVVQEYLYAILQTRDFFDYSVSVSMRSGMPKINRSELNQYSFYAPSGEEQSRIGQFLLSFDNQITLHQRKLEKLQDLKKAYLHEMFI